jgi:hypothetical protein
LRENEQRVALDPQQEPVVRIPRSVGGSPAPLAQQCLRDLRELKPTMRESEAVRLLKAFGFHQNLPATVPTTFPVAKSIDTFERHDIFLSDRYPRHELHLILHEESEPGHYRLHEWYIDNLDTGTRTEDADVIRQAQPHFWSQPRSPPIHR